MSEKHSDLAVADSGRVQMHTPGTWVAKFAADGCGDIGIVADGGCLAEVFKDIRSAEEGAHDECVANARLIAAAPELLGALQRTLNWLSSYPGGGTMAPYGPYEQAREAIAKATGAQP